ncbi:carbohydrate ABC transporter permease [Paenibacillaceae bacterium WGS1546]|uniref:carbohydrate ABC transporter permease n=1 Tax=Cohnella sp. WGS1546 TaxID=3366810 RepID=UPI00372D27EF
MLVIAIISVFPILWMSFGSFRPHAELFQYSSSLNWHLLIPLEWTLDNYRQIFLESAISFGRYMVNTLLVGIIVTAFSLAVNSMAAFSFAKLSLPYRGVILTIFLSALIIPPEVTLVPLYLLIRDLGLVDSYQALILPSIVSVFSIFLLIQFFADIPRELLEAARIDGASWARVYATIMLPGAASAMVTLGLITFLGQWDAYLWPLVVINDEARQMIQVAVAGFSNLQGTQWGRILAADTISSVPILILFLFLQRYYVQSITLTGVKA